MKFRLWWSINLNFAIGKQSEEDYEIIFNGEPVNEQIDKEEEK